MFVRIKHVFRVLIRQVNLEDQIKIKRSLDKGFKTVLTLHIS